jgi:hypothetical protein
MVGNGGLLEELRSNHGLVMALGCVVPLVIIAVAAALGFREAWVYWTAIGLMVAMHVWLMAGSKHCGGKQGLQKHWKK